MSKKYIFPCAVLVLSHSVFAVELPNTGSQMQQIPPAPRPERVIPKIDINLGQASRIQAADSVKIVVTSLQLRGEQAYSEATLLAVTGFKPGSELSLTDLRAMASRIADYYHANGYFVAQAYLPAQDIKDGVVTIAVIDGSYGQVKLNNQTNISSPLAYGLLGGLYSGDPVLAGPLENRLLLLSDLPGVNINSTLVPGASMGTSDLIVNMTQGNRISGSVDADNAGNLYTGVNRVGATINFNEPLGLGDVASLRALTSGTGLNYARGSYQLQLGKATAGVAYSALEYKLSDGNYDGLGFNGTVQVASIYGSYPLIRSRNENLYAGLNYDDKTFKDKLNSTSYDKKAQVLTASLYGSQRDGFGGGGVTTNSLALSAGNIDSDFAVTKGYFNKLGFNMTRMQRLTDKVSLSAAANGQFASKRLDSSEQMELGGMYGVRAYPEGEAYGDEGYVLNLEARLQLPKYSEQFPGQIQLIGFIDTGSVSAHGEAGTRRTLNGAGIGLNWSDTNNFMLRVYYAFKLGDEKATSAPDESGRFWIQGVKYF
jgi:hemolysin activation/secretion protein